MIASLTSYSSLVVDALIVCGVAGGIVIVALLRRLPLFRGISSPVESAASRRADNAERELTDALAAITKLEQEVKELKKERSLSSVIQLVERVSEGVDATLEKLGDLNGGLKASARAHEASAEALATSTKAIEFLASQVIVQGMDRGPQT